MVDRVSLLQTMEPLIEPPASQREAIRKLLDKAVVQATLALPKQAAQSLPATMRDELEIVIRDYFTPAELAKLATLWEPNRPLDGELKQNLTKDMIDLLHNRRPSYSGFKCIPLEEARRSPEIVRLMIQRLAQTKDLKKLLKDWDKHLKPMPVNRREISDRLLRLLGGAKPAERAQATRTRRRAA